MKVVKKTTKYYQGQIFWSPDKTQCALKTADLKIKVEGKPEWLTPKIGNGVLNVSMYGNDIKSITPVNGLLNVQFNSIVSREDEPPVPKTVTQFDKQVQKFWTLWDVLTEGWEGAQVTLGLEYSRFERNTVDNTVFIADTGGKAANQLITFCQVTDLINQTIPWSENILPTIEPLCVKGAASFLYKKGFVVEAVPGDAAPTVEEQESFWDEADSTEGTPEDNTDELADFV